MCPVHVCLIPYMGPVFTVLYIIQFICFATFSVASGSDVNRLIITKASRSRFKNISVATVLYGTFLLAHITVFCNGWFILLNCIKMTLS